jgi:hypothetical protein
LKGHTPEFLSRYTSRLSDVLIAPQHRHVTLIAREYGSVSN